MIKFFANNNSVSLCKMFDKLKSEYLTTNGDKLGFEGSIDLNDPGVASSIKFTGTYKEYSDLSVRIKFNICKCNDDRHVHVRIQLENNMISFKIDGYTQNDTWYQFSNWQSAWHVNNVIFDTDIIDDLLKKYSANENWSHFYEYILYTKYIIQEINNMI